jgi:hypothetical protein
MTWVHEIHAPRVRLVRVLAVRRPWVISALK